MTGQGKGVSSCGVGLCQIKLRLNPDFTVSVTPGGSCAYRVPRSTSPYVRVMLQYADVTGRHRCLSKGRGTSTLQEMARNCCYLDFVLCQWGGRALLLPEDRAGKRSGTEDPQSKSMCIERSLEKEIPGGGHFRFLCSVTLVFLPCSEPYLWPAQL